MRSNYIYENNLYKSGVKLIGGIDEVGRGPLVGPVVAALVILPKNFYLSSVTDSKKISEKKRNELYEIINKKAISIGIGVVSSKRIDEINILNATKEAMLQAIKNSKVKPEHILIDAVKLKTNIPSTSIIKGDLLSHTISAASIIAKVTRDKMMYELDEKYPMYDFKNNKGYGTKKHLSAIKEYGVISEHRKSFRPVSEALKKEIVA